MSGVNGIRSIGRNNCTATARSTIITSKLCSEMLGYTRWKSISTRLDAYIAVRRIASGYFFLILYLSKLTKRSSFSTISFGILFIPLTGLYVHVY